MRIVPFAAALALAAAATAGPVQVQPEARSFRLGAVELTALRDAINAVPNDGSVFGKDVGPAAVAGALSQAGAPTDTLPLGVDALLVRLPGRLVLIDTGLGPKVHGALMGSLAAAHVKPSDIDYVLITHSHGDHVGGLLTSTGALAFPRATIRMAAAEWQFMQSKADPATIATLTPQIETFAPGMEVVPGIRSVTLPGHTPGHSGYEITSGGKRLLDIGDTAHSAVISLAHPEWIIGYDTDSAQGRATREAELARLAASGEPVFAPHFPFPGVGRIVKRASGYAFVPGAP